MWSDSWNIYIFFSVYSDYNLRMEWTIPSASLLQFNGCHLGNVFYHRNKLQPGKPLKLKHTTTAIFTPKGSSRRSFIRSYSIFCYFNKLNWSCSNLVEGHTLKERFRQDRRNLSFVRLEPTISKRTTLTLCRPFIQISHENKFKARVNGSCARQHVSLAHTPPNT